MDCGELQHLTRFTPKGEDHATGAPQLLRNETKLREIEQSIRAQGILVPLIV